VLNLDRSRNDTAVALDAMRATAAQMVCVGHAMVYFQVKPEWLPKLPNIGVLVFFILSGFLITGTLVQKSQQGDYGFGRYFVDRFARIYSGLLPSLVFIVAVDGVTILLTREQTIARYYNLPTLLANLGMLEGYRGIFDRSYLQWPVFGSASPLWTLGIEWHIYMFVGAAFFVLKARSRWWPLLIPVACFFGQTPIHYLSGALSAGGPGSGLFSLWLAGAALYLLFSRYVPPVSFSLAAFFAAAVVYARLLKPGDEYDFATYPALITMFAAVVALSQRTNWLRNVSLPKMVADYSFTLYLTHHTLIVAIVTIYPAAAGWLWLLATVAACNAVAWSIAWCFETRHKKFAAWLIAR